MFKNSLLPLLMDISLVFMVVEVAYSADFGSGLWISLLNYRPGGLVLSSSGYYQPCSLLLIMMTNGF